MTIKEGLDTVCISESLVSFSGRETSAAFTDFDITTYEEPPVQAAGYVKGSVILTDTPSPRPEVRINARSELDIDGRDDYYTVNADGSFEIPFVEEFLDVLGERDQTLRFDLWVGPDMGGFPMPVPASKVAAKKDLAGGNLEVGSLGEVSIASITLSGTISVKINNQTVPRVMISARVDSISEGGSIMTYASGAILNNPAEGQAWTTAIQKPAAGTTVTFSVFGLDANGNYIFQRDNVTSRTVSTQNVSGIALNLGDIKTVTLRGTVDVTLNGARPYRVEISAYTDPDRYGGDLGYTTISNYAGLSFWTIQAESPKTDATLYFFVSMLTTQSGEDWTGSQTTDVTRPLTANTATPLTGIAIKKDYTLSIPRSANSAALRKLR
jgi:hypothetical protein